MIAILAAALLASPSAQDAKEYIKLVDGSTLEVDSIESETYEEVTYRKGSAEGRRDAEKVLSVRHHLGHQLLDDYAVAVQLMEQDGDFAQAYGRFQQVLDDGVGERRRFSWVTQHALFRMARCAHSLGDAEAVGRVVDELLERDPDTFFYGQALGLKAKALAATGDKEAAREVWRRLESDADAKGLPRRWIREAELGLLLLDDGLNGEDKKRRLQGLAEKNADSYPTVAARARVEIGNVMVEEGDYEEARNFFEGIVESGSADDATMAAAIAGLGDCSYFEAQQLDDIEKARPLFEDAALYHLQVIGYYREQVRLVSRSLYFAGSAMYNYGDRPAAERVAATARDRFGKSTWTDKLFQELNLLR